MPVTQVYVENIDDGFVESVRKWGELLNGEEQWGWGTYCAEQEFLKVELLNLGKTPSRAPTDVEAAALRQVAAFNKTAKTNPTLITTTTINKVKPAIATVKAYVQEMWEVTFIDWGTNPKVARSLSLAEIEGYAKTVEGYARPPAPTDPTAVPQQALVGVELQQPDEDLGQTWSDMEIDSDPGSETEPIGSDVIDLI